MTKCMRSGSFTLLWLLLLTNSFVVNAATKSAVLIFAAEMIHIERSNNGSYPELASLLKQYRQQNQPTFFIFGGGSLGPSSLSSFDRGAHIIDILNTLEPDVLGVAKREFSFFEDELSLRTYEAAFPVVASNIFDPLTLGQLDGLVSSAILQQGGMRIGFISVLDESVISEYALKRIQLLPPIHAIEKYTNQLRQQNVDLVVLHYSNQLDFVDELLTQGVIDIALRKDEHFHLSSVATRPTHPHNIFLTETNQAAVINIDIANQPKLINVQWISQSLDELPQDPIVLNQIIQYSSHLNSLLSEQIGTLITPLDTSRLTVRTQENPLGNFIADSIKNVTRADIALINGGTIRGETIYQTNHPITWRDMAKELPFRNSVVVIEVTGEQLLLALESGLSQIHAVKGRFPQVSGLQVTFNSNNPVNQRVLKVLVNGETLVKERNYKLATSDYIADGGDGYTIFKQSNVIPYQPITRFISDIVIEAIRTQEIISPKIENRLSDVAKHQEPQHD